MDVEILNHKVYRILSALLEAEKPLTVTEIASSTGFRRQTIEPYIAKNIVNGHILDVGSDEHAWVINEKSRQEIAERVATFSVSAEKDRKPTHVHLIDADSKISNLALMKLSAYHKSRGDKVTMSKGAKVDFVTTIPDKIYISIIFKKNKHMFDNLKSLYPYSQIDIGGSGYDLEKVLPPEVEIIKPDYSLYPENDYSINFSSRGCVRSTTSCPWCIVPIKEGKYRRTQHPTEWFCEDYDTIVFLDNNALADKQYFMEVTDWCAEKGLSVWFTQGLDIRLMDRQVAEQIFKMKTYKSIFFAWDRLEDEPIIREKVDLLKSVGFTDSMCRAKIQFYVYIDSDKEFDSGLYRCLELRKLSCNSFVMFNIDNERSKRVHILQRWANRKRMYWCESPESRRLLLELQLMADGNSQILLDDYAETQSDSTITSEKITV